MQRNSMSDTPDTHIYSDMPDSLAQLMRDGNANSKSRPVEQWNPDYCGKIDMRIASDGTWYYQGTPIQRPAMVALFASILRRDEDGKTYLVTPVEKVEIEVEDAPFVVVDLAGKGTGKDQAITVRTNVGDIVQIDRDHPLRFAEDDRGGFKPYVRVRGRLEALFARSMIPELLKLTHSADDEQIILWSGGEEFSCHYS
jgi:hypothetical protein